MAKALGEVIKRRREARGLTLMQLSDMSGVSAAHIGRTEKGERFPSGRVLRNLAKPLGFAETELLKLAGYLSRDDGDVRVDRLKQELKAEIERALSALCAKIDSL